MSSEELAETVSSYRKRIAEHKLGNITEEEALADLWHRGVHCNETLAAANRRTAVGLDAHYGVINHPEELRGWQVSVEPWKPGVLKLFRTRRTSLGAESMTGFVSTDVFRVAIETHVITKPDGYVMAP